mmetsp:Transcript_27615/g.44495  ORF Transcript_27615/g.44495 Transcript_27615/m.44495 type:complete len:101 (-) Transcript_27615:213-515(-)
MYWKALKELSETSPTSNYGHYMPRHKTCELGKLGGGERRERFLIDANMYYKIIVAGTKPRLTWTQVQACDSYQANTMMKSRYEYDDTWQSLGRSNSRLQL